MNLYLINPLNVFMLVFSLVIIIGGITYFVNERITRQIGPYPDTDTDTDTDSIINAVHV
jgi:hypothetical protein